MGFDGSRDHEHRRGSDRLEGLDRAARGSEPEWKDDDAQLQLLRCRLRWKIHPGDHLDGRHESPDVAAVDEVSASPDGCASWCGTQRYRRGSDRIATASISISSSGSASAETWMIESAGYGSE